jgi:phenylacetate-CoA ligase
MPQTKEKSILSALSSFAPGKNYALEFANFDIAVYEKMLREKGEDFWRKAGEKKALRLFHEASERVPAYKDFLKKNKVRPETVRVIADFQKLPFTNKKNYSEVYPISAQMWGGTLEHSKVFAASSGTTSDPRFWPRGGSQEFEAAVLHELYYRYFFNIHKMKTLLIVGFPVGLNVSGMATVLPSLAVGGKQHSFTVAPIGTNKKEILHIIRTFQDEYDQIILAAHPFFAKDILETGKEEGIDWKKKPFRLFFASEGFNEVWREYVLSFVQGSSPLPSVSVYGCADMLLVGSETPLSIFVKKLSEGDTAVRDTLFGGGITPSLFQYNPLSRYIESDDDGKLLFTSVSGIPLIRFHPGDSGKVLSHESVMKELGNIAPKENTSIRKNSWKLPFLALGGRSDYTVPFRFTNVDPSYIKQALQDKAVLGKLTGKFVLRSEATHKDLEVHAELRHGIKPTPAFRKLIEQNIVDVLRASDYRYEYMYTVLKKDVYPKIFFWPYQHEKYFKPGTKPKVVVRDI